MEWPIMNFASGPVAVTARTLQDQARPVLYHYDPAFIEFFEHTTSLLKQVYRTGYDVIIMQGEAILGLEAAAASLISPGDKVLNLASGVFGKWYQLFIEKYGGVTVELSVPFNDAVRPEMVEEALEKDPEIKFLSVVHSETPSSTNNPVAEIGPIAKEHGVLTIVDTVSGLGGELLSPEAWGIDIAVAGPQKCLGGTPGLSLMAISPAAWNAMEAKKSPLRGSYLSILDWKDAWIDEHRFPYTPSVSDIYALESVLAQVLEEGIEAYVARHERIARACRAGIRALGLELWVAREDVAGSACTAVHIPAGLSDEQLRGHMRKRYGVMISGGYGELAGQLFRLGHMGKVAHPSYLAAQLAVLERSLADLGMAIEFGAGVGAAMAALADWNA